MTAAVSRPTTAHRLLVVLDVDSTLIENEAIELLSEEAGSFERVAAITARAMAGEIDFTESLRERVATLAGLDVARFGDIGARLQLTPGAAELIDGVHGAGGQVAVVSGGFHELLDPLAESLQLDHWRANRLEVAEGRLTGRVFGAVIDAQAKADALTEWAADTNIPLEATVAIGDGANDLRMMAVAGLSIAFCAKPVVSAHADVSIQTRDLSQVLPLLGLRG